MKYLDPYKLYGLPDPKPFLRRHIKKEDIPTITIESLGCEACDSGGCMVGHLKKDKDEDQK